jgi:leader peptidase (prepilin peptidase)/N-methyltransferase
VLPAYLYLAAVGLALALIDLDCKRLPDALTLPSYPVRGLLLGCSGPARQRHGQPSQGAAGRPCHVRRLLRPLLRLPAGMGFGDVKLSGVLGLYTAWLGWGVWAVGLFLGFLLGGVFGIG